MASLLELLRKKDPNMSLDTARSAMGLEPSAQFNFLGEHVPQAEIPPAPPLLEPIQKPVPEEPQMLLERPKVQEQEFPTQEIVAKRPIMAKPKRDFAKEQQNSLSKLEESEDNGPTDEEVDKNLQEALNMSAPKEENLGEATEATRENLLAAQQKANSAEDAAFWTKLGTQLGGSLGKVSKGVTDTGMKMADTIATIGKRDQTQLQERIALEKQDPNSRYSVAVKNFIKDKFNVDVPEGISAEQLDKTFLSPALKAFEADQTREANKLKLAQEFQNRKEIEAQKAIDRRETAQMLAQMNAPIRQAALDDRRSAMEDRNQRYYSGQLENLKKLAIQGGGVAGNQIRNKIQFADNIFATAGSDANLTEKDLEKLPASTWNHVNKTMAAELGIELNKLLTATGTPAQKTLEKLIPNNILMDKTKIQDYITSKLNPAQQGEFVKQVLKTAARVKEVGKTQNKELMKKFFAGSDRIKKYVPEDYDRALQELGLDPADFNNNKSLTPKKEASILDKVPNPEALEQKLNDVNSMSEEELDELLKGIK